MALRAMGPFNGILPIPTDMLIAFMRDPSKMPYLRYSQFVPAPEVVFMYARLDPDEVVRLPTIDEYAWAYDDYRPTGKAWSPRLEWIDSRVQRWDFPYRIGDTTQRVWGKQGIPVKAMMDRMRMSHAMLHRAVRCISALQGAAWGTFNTGTIQQLLALPSAAYFDQSSGNEQDPVTGLPNPSFQIIKRTLTAIKRRLNLQTNAALTGEELVWVMDPLTASAVAQSGEMVNFLKQSQFAKELTNPNLADWSLPESYGGFKIVVEDTPRVFIHQAANDTTVADVTIPAQKDYILPKGSNYFVSRPGGFDGDYGTRNFSTVQVYHFGGEARVEAYSMPKDELTEGHVVTEDRVIIPTVLGAFQLTGALSAGYAG